MRRTLFALGFGFAGLLLCVGLFYMAGSLWGPLYQGEDEATRNFKVFLVAIVASVAIGMGIGLKVGKGPV